jgi:hypothetical protein
VLEHALAAGYGAGTNLKGRGAGAAWTFLLPTLELDTVVCLGLPADATLLTLGRLGARVLVACSPRHREGAERRVAALGLAHLEVVAPDDERLTVGVDLVLVDPHAPGKPLAAGIVERAATAFVDGPVGPGNGWQPLWLTPRAGEVHCAAALDDEPTIAFLRGATLGGARGRTPLRRAAHRVVRRSARGERRGLLRGAGAGPPAYVREIAARAGVDLSGCRVGLSAPSEYASRKAVLFLFAGDEPAPRWVVKLTREPEHNRRLDNEWDALVCLRDAGIGDERTLPRPVFHGHHAGLAVVGETAVAGTPLRSGNGATADSAPARAALRWLLELGERSATRIRDTAVAAAALTELRERFVALYDLTDRQRGALVEQIDRIARADTLPLVFEHGDPGSWNVLVSADGRPIFLDWEAFERHGLPLWDAFYFARSHAVSVGRAGGARDALQILRTTWLEDSPPARELAQRCREHADRIGLQPELIEPLFVTCWMHRALKEAGRLTAPRLQRGHYASLLKLVLDRRDAPGLRRLYGAP